MNRLIAVITCLLVSAVGATAALQVGPVDDAAAKGNVVKLKALLKKSPALANAKDKQGATPLHYAAAAGRKETADLLIARGANVMSRKQDGVTPLHVAAAAGHTEIARLLLDHKADPSAKDNKGRTPLSLAEQNGRTAVAELIRSRLAGAAQLAEGMVDSMGKGDFASATRDFGATMKAVMSAEKLGETWWQLTAQYGPFKSRTGSREAQEAGFQTVHVTCVFEKASLDVKVVFSSSGQISGLWINPTQSAEVPYRLPSYAHIERLEEHVALINKGGEWQLMGTLTLPNGEGPFPAVVLVHGSGPQDQDGVIGPNRPFKDIAWGLASNGVAVLRYEKRSKVHTDPAKWNKNFTVKEEVIDDALAAVEVLRSSEKIDSKRVFVLGHSLGGILIPRIGKADPKITGLIMMAGCLTQPMEDTILRQLTYIASLSGPITEDTRKEIDQALQSTLKCAPASYFADLRDYIPAAAKMAESLKQPMLILQGARDYQVTTDDFKIWKDALSSRTDVTCKLYLDLNHLFMAGVGMATPAEYEKPGTVAQSVVSDISDWINGQ